MKDGWIVKKLGEVCSLLTDGDWIESKDQSLNGIRLIQTGNVGNGIYKDKADHAKYISEETFDRLNCTEIFEGDILISRLPEPIGRACILPKIKCRMITAVDCSIVRLKDILMPKFLVFYTLSRNYNKGIEKYVTGAVRKRISRANLSKIALPIPPLPEQSRIVEELDQLSNIIEKKRQQLSELDNLAQSIFYDMFGDPVVNEKGWVVKKLGEVCDVRDGTHDSPKYLEHSDYVLITSKNIINGDIDYTSINYISEEDYNNINKRSFVEDGDIIMAMIGTIGKPIIVKRKGVKFCIKNVALIKFRDSKEVINTYIQSLLDNSSYMQYINKQNKGGTQKFISLGAIRKLDVPLPSLPLQQLFAQKIEAIEAEKALIKQSIAETEELFNSRMDYYFS